MRRVTTIAIGVCALALAGCYESADVTVHQPGVYKGVQDPLLKTDASKRNQELMARFNQVHRDR